MSNTQIHSTALIEQDVTLGDGTAVWDNVHIRHGAQLGKECIVGEKSYIAYDVQIGNRVKINAMVYICYGVTLEDGVMISAGTVFTNDQFPRATTSDLASLRDSGPDEQTLKTVVAEGATLGARVVVGPGLRIGRFAMVGMGCVVTHDVEDFHLVVGSPARSVGCVCRCGQPLVRWKAGSRRLSKPELECVACQAEYRLSAGTLHELPARAKVSTTDQQPSGDLPS